MNDKVQHIADIADTLRNSGVGVAYARRRDRTTTDVPQQTLLWKGPKGGFGRSGAGLRAGFNVRYEAYTRERETHTHLLITVTPGALAGSEFYTDDIANTPPHPNRPYPDSWDGWDGDTQAGLKRIVEVFGGI